MTYVDDITRLISLRHDADAIYAATPLFLPVTLCAITIFTPRAQDTRCACLSDDMTLLMLRL